MDMLKNKNRCTTPAKLNAGSVLSQSFVYIY